MNWKEHALETKKSIYDLEGKTMKFSKYSEVYPFATECINGYLKSSLPKNAKNALTVLSSSDQLFNLLVNGVEEITTFDINLVTYYYFELKKAYIMKNNYESFVDLIRKSYNFKTSFLGLLVNQMDDYAQYMSKDTYNFWNELKKLNMNFTYLQYMNSSLFQVREDNEYVEDEKKYETLRSILKNGFNHSFYNCSIMQLDQLLCKQFDYMNFSNIYDYSKNFIQDTQPRNVFYQYIKEQILPYLKEQGNTMITYTYSTKNDFLENQDLSRISIYGKHSTAYVFKK